MNSVAYSPDGLEVATGDRANQLTLWDLALECQHLMPYGDVPVLLGFAGVLGVCKARYLASQKAE